MDINRLLLRFGLAVGATIPLLLLLQFTVLGNLPGSDYFMPHVHCYLDDPAMVMLQGGSDFFIGLSYLVISITLGILVYRGSRNIPFPLIFLAFGIFIIACGSGHFMEIVTLWNPVYWLSGSVKVITALASVVAAVVLPPTVPKILNILEAARISEERKEELERLYSKLKESDELKTQFFANVSHELRTPLTLIVGPVEKLRRDERLDEAQQQELEVVERNSRLLLKHINDLLDIAKLDAGGMELEQAPVDLSLLLRLAAAHFESLARERKITLHVDAPKHLFASVDPGKMERVVVNLLSNAFKFTPVGGKVRCRLAAANDHLEIQIADSGPGVPLELRGRIFERFQQGMDSATRQQAGTGLGLAIAKEFVELHGGRIAIDDAPEGGAEFSIKLPGNLIADEAEIDPENENAVISDLALHDVRQIRAEQAPAAAIPQNDDAQLVLVVEDNPDMRNFIAATLSERFRVRTANDGTEGLSMARMERPDLILSDIMMPKMSGDRFVRAIREDREFDNTPIVMLTAKADDKMMVDLLRNGAQEYLVKPFSPEGLKARVGNLLALKQIHDTMENALQDTSRNVDTLRTELVHRNETLHEALRMLQRSEARFRRLVEANVIGVTIIRLDGTIAEANDAFLEMTGHSRVELNARSLRWNRMVAPQSQEGIGEENTPELAELLDNGVVHPLEKEYLRDDGSRVPVLVGGALLDGNEQECIIFVLDLTERKQMEVELRHARDAAETASRAKDRFLAILSHELRTPLTPVMTAAYVMAEDPGLNEESREMIDIITKNIQVEVKLIEDLLDLTKLTDGTLQLRSKPAYLDSILMSAVDTSEQELIGKGIQVTMNLDAEQNMMIGDESRLQQIFRIILGNAAKFTPNGGSVRISTRNVSPDSIAIEITDSGIGISPEILPTIFTPFEQGERTISRTYGGLGVGLSICKSLVEMHGGTITATSEGTDRGATFVVTLPVVEENVAA